MNVSPTGSGSHSRPLADVDSLPYEISDDLVVQLVGAAFARAPLGLDEFRDVRLIAFLLDISARTSEQQLARQSSETSHVVVVDDRLRSLSGLSAGRVQRSLSRLLEARVLEQAANDPPSWFRLAPRVMRPAGLDQYVSWTVVATKIAGHVPAILLLRAILDLVTVPWDWTRLTYDQLAARASYSLGMAQRGVMQLLELGVVERANHSGRGHDYRLSPWALGRGPIPEPVRVIAQAVGQISQGERTQVSDSARRPDVMSTMAVEIGGLVLRVPIGTEIRMTIGADGGLQYEVGSELKITPRG